MSDLDRAQAYAALPAEFLDEEPATSQARWPCYGPLPAVDATRLFLKVYMAVYRSFWDARVGVSGAGRHRAPLAEYDIFKNDNGEFVSLWRARQHADAFGLPYSFYIRSAFERCAANTELPRPNQLYSQEVTDYVRDRAQTSPWAILDCEPEESEFLGSLLPSAGYSRCRRRGLLAYLRQAPFQRRPENFRGVRDRGIFKALRQPVDARGHGVERNVPGCFGLPFACDNLNEICATCPAYGRCASEADYALELVYAEHGNIFPRDVHRREQNRINKQKSRARRGAAKGPTKKGTRKRKPHSRGARPSS